MPVPTADGAERAAEYAATRARIRTLLQDVTDAEADAIVPACPDWSVRNLVAHLAGVCRDLVEKNHPTGDVQAWVDRQVAERATRSVVSLLDEFDEFGPGFEELIVKRPDARGGLLYDIVAHEHDAASALGRRAERDTEGVRLSIDIMAALIDGDLARAGLPAVRLSDGRNTWEVGTGEPGFSVSAPDTFELMRFLGSRRSLAQMRTFAIDGDLDRFLPGLAHLPLPEHDLIE
jgi:uncharacterized protein (TIGR03083 family)